MEPLISNGLYEKSTVKKKTKNQKPMENKNETTSSTIVIPKNKLGKSITNEYNEMAQYNLYFACNILKIESFIVCCFSINAAFIHNENGTKKTPNAKKIVIRSAFKE